MTLYWVENSQFTGCYLFGVIRELKQTERQRQRGRQVKQKLVFPIDDIISFL